LLVAKTKGKLGVVEQLKERLEPAQERFTAPQDPIHVTDDAFNPVKFHDAPRL
jgi:hypothetical protein